MTQEAFRLAIHNWQSFYTLLGEVSATLTGLMFVAATFGASFFTDETEYKVRTFVTPTVVHFSLVLLLSALMNIPTQTQGALTAEFVVVGFSIGGYSVSHLPYLLRLQREGNLSRLAWAWNLVPPLLSALGLLAAAFSLRLSVSMALDVAAVSTLLLVQVGIHNAWEVTLRIAKRIPS